MACVWCRGLACFAGFVWLWYSSGFVLDLFVWLLMLPACLLYLGFCFLCWIWCWFGCWVCLLWLWCFSSTSVCFLWFDCWFGLFWVYLCCRCVVSACDCDFGFAVRLGYTVGGIAWRFLFDCYVCFFGF